MITALPLLTVLFNNSIDLSLNRVYYWKFIFGGRMS